MCSGDAGIRFGEDGSVTGMSDKFWNHADQLMAIAAEQEIYIMATMMSFDCCKNGNRNNKKFRAMIEDEALSQSYVDNYIIFYVVLNHKTMEVRRFLYKGQNKDNIL